MPGDNGVHPYWRVWNNSETVIRDGRKYLLFAHADVTEQWIASYPCYTRDNAGRAQWVYA